MSEHTELLVATNNKGKVRELSQLLSDFPLRLRLLDEFPDIVEAEETGETFAENATIKALHYSARSGLLTLSDDSGLVVDALGGAPGVRSARYAGREATYAERMSKLISELDLTGDAERRARFVCVRRRRPFDRHAPHLRRRLRRSHRPRPARHRRLRLRPALHPRRPRPNLRRASRRGQTQPQPPRTRASASRPPPPRASHMNRLYL
jgi:hypothetical protein